MAFCDHVSHVVVGFNFAGQLVPQDVDQIMAGEHAGGDVPMRQALFGVLLRGLQYKNTSPPAARSSSYPRAVSISLIWQSEQPM